MNNNIKVAVRVRPLIKREKDNKLSAQWNVEGNNIYQIDDTGQKNTEAVYSFDHIFDPNKSNKEIYEVVVKDFIDSSLDGINSTIFAYGQTSSGKTYTMFGDRREKGIIPIAIDDIFTMIDASSDKKFLLRVSYVEIYNEKINDLLDITNNDIKIREDPDGNILLHNVHEEIASSRDQVYDCLRRGDTNRHIGNTDANERSSRSHTIFKIMIECRDVSDFDDEDSPVHISNLNLVDLAGSERVAQTKATGARLKEGGHINKSLSTLALVIRQLTEGQRFINFRDSKLTRLLQQSLGGNAKTLIIATITLTSVENTNSTLAFAGRAKMIKNEPKVNEILNDADAKNRYAQLNADLRKKLEVELSKNKDLKHKNENLEEIVRLQEQMKTIHRFQHHSIENSILSAVVSKRRHTIAHRGHKDLKSILEVPDEVFTSSYSQLSKTPASKDTSVYISEPRTKEASVQCYDLFSESSTSPNTLRLQMQSLAQEYEELVQYTRDENEVMAKNSEKVEELEKKLNSASQNLTEMKHQHKIEEELITTQLTNKFKRREEELVNKVGDLEKQLATYKTTPVKIDERIAVACSLNFNSDEEYNYFKNQLFRLEAILKNCEMGENTAGERSKRKESVHHIMDKFNSKIETTKQIIENEIWKQISIFSEVSEQLTDHHCTLPNEVDSFNNLLKELMDFENDAIELSNNDNRNIENLKLLNKIYEFLLKQNQLIGWCSEKFSSLQEETKLKDELYTKKLNAQTIEIDNQATNIDELKVEIEEKNNIITRLTHDKTSLEKEFEIFRQKYEETIGDLKKELEDKKKIIAALKHDQTTSEENFKIFRQKYLSLETSIDQLKVEVEEKKNIITTLEHHRSSLEEKCGVFRQKYLSLETNIEDLKVELEDKKNIITTMKHDQTTSEENFEIFRQKYFSLETTIDDLKVELEEKKNIITTLEHHRTSLEETCGVFRQKCFSLEINISDLKVELEDKKNIITTMKHDQTTSEENFEIFRQKYFSLETSIDDLKVELEEKKNIITTLEHHRTSLEEKCGVFRQKCFSLETNISDLKVELEDKKKIITTMKHDQTSSEENFEIFRQKYFSLETSVNELKVELEEKKNIITTLEHHRTSLEEKCGVLRQKCFSLETKINELKVELEGKKNTETTLRHDQASLEQELKILRQKCLGGISAITVTNKENIRDEETKRKILELELQLQKKDCLINNLKDAKQQLECTFGKIIEQFIKDEKALLTVRQNQELRNCFKDNRKNLKANYARLKEQLQQFPNGTYNLDTIYQLLTSFSNVTKEHFQLEKSYLQSELDDIKSTNRSYVKEITALKKNLEEGKDNSQDTGWRLGLLNNKNLPESLKALVFDNVQGEENGVSCVKCVQLNDKIAVLKKQVKDQLDQIVYLREQSYKAHEEQKKKSDFHYSEFFQLVVDSEKELRAKVEKYEKIIADYKAQNQSEDNKKFECSKCEILLEKNKKYKAIAISRRQENLTLEAELRDLKLKCIIK